MSINIINISTSNVLQLQQKLLLVPGQVLKGQVAEIQGNQVVLQFGNDLLKAETRVKLRSGQKLKLLVESVNNGFISLKVLPGNETIRPEDLILLRMGIKPQENIEAVIREFLRFQMPLNPQDIMEIITFIKDNKLSEEILSLIVWLKSTGIKIKSGEDLNALKDLYRFFRGEFSGRDEARFFNFLNESENTSSEGYNIFGWPLGKHHIYLLTPGSKKERLQPETCQLFLRLKSRVLEELWVKLDSIQNNLNVDILCNNEKHRLIIDKEIISLQKTLQSAGYHVGKITVEVGRVNTIFDLLPGHGQGIATVNIKV